MLIKDLINEGPNSYSDPCLLVNKDPVEGEGGHVHGQVGSGWASYLGTQSWVGHVYRRKGGPGGHVHSLAVGGDHHHVQWNESSQDTSGGSYHGHKMNFYKIPAMVGIFFWFRGLLETFIFFSSFKSG